MSGIRTYSNESDVLVEDPMSVVCTYLITPQKN